MFLDEGGPVGYLYEYKLISRTSHYYKVQYPKLLCTWHSSPGGFQDTLAYY